MATFSAPISQVNETNSRPRTSLRGASLWLARSFWLVAGAASLGLIAAILPLLLRQNDYGDWMIERTAQLFGINIYSGTFDTYALALFGLKYVAVTIFVGVALYIFWRKSDDWMAILVSVLLLTLPHTFNLVGYTDNWYLYRYPWDRLLPALDAFYNAVGNALLYLVFFLFPDGRFVPHWTRWFAISAFVLVMLLWLSEFLHAFVVWDDTYTWAAAIIFILGLLVLVTWSQIYRYRNISTPAQQAQTRLVVLSLVTIVTMYLLFIPPALGLTGFLDSPLGAFVSLLVGTFGLALLPLAFGVAMLRDRLWQSERVLNRAFLYGALSAILLVVYIVIIGTLSEIFRATNNFLISAIATGVVALLFHPLRERLQRSINRFLYGQRDEPFIVLNQLGAQLENTIAPDTALPMIVETIARAMRAPYAAIELTTNDKGRTTEYGSRTNHLVTLPLRYQNETIGELKIARRAPNENFWPADLQLLENLARQAGAVVYAARLNAQLQQSRERIIAERENERKRLRRDLHDGLGPTLASQTLKLDAALELLHGDDAANARARKILQELKSQTQNTVADIRRIVYELRPPALDDLGLAGALRAHLAQYHTANGFQIRFDAPDELPPLSAAVQLNAYRIVLEAVNNVVKHASAKNCIVRITCQEKGSSELGDLRLEIADDGIGLSENFRAGVGVTSMRERAEELGGTLHFEPNESHGTRVIATLPISQLFSPK